MTRAVPDRIPRDASGDIGNHLRNHVHLTNCIHLKNHMHKHSPVVADRSIMRDLVVLQRSRSLRDPSASPPSWHSPHVVNVLAKRSEKDASVGKGRRSIRIDRQRDHREVSGSSPISASFHRAEVKTAVSDRSGKRVFAQRHNKKDVLNQRNLGFDIKGGNEEFLQYENGTIHNIVSRSSKTKDKKMKLKGRLKENGHLKTLSVQLKEARMDSDVGSPHFQLHGAHSQKEKTAKEAGASIRGYRSGFDKIKRRKCQGKRRIQNVKACSRDAGKQNEMSVASNSLARSSGQIGYRMEEGEEEYDEQNVTRAPRNGCGIPWNWSRIHHSGKSFLDIAGRSLSCGLSDTKLKKSGPVSQGIDASVHSSSSTESDAEALPLLVEASGSQQSTNNAASVDDYSGELGIFVDNLLKNDIDSDLASEARSNDEQRFGRNHRCRHQSLTQKYMPRTFRDLVGQNLVAQALSNALTKRKIGLLYVFYGSHGTGKTSCAQIFARALNCRSSEQLKPCGSCNPCIAYDMGKSRNIREVGPLSNFDFESIMDVLDNMIVSHLSSQYRVFIFDDCDTLSPDCWSAISKLIDRTPRHVVFVLVSSSLDVLPHVVVSRCQKFFFPKLKDADIINAMQWIATKEEIEIDKDALKLIASRSDGSLREAEMTLEQLSLLGQKISVPLVQELVGLISDEKLVDLLDLALSADTVNTVKNLREIMESGVEPLALMSQLAAVITDILAGSYDCAKERPRRKFFRRQALSKEEMEKLCQALKTLCEAEKQLRMSNDRLTWLTAALLQLAPDQQYMLPGSSGGTSSKHSPLVQKNSGRRLRPRKSNVEHAEMPNTERRLPSHVTKIENLSDGSSSDVYHSGKMNGNTTDRRRHAAPLAVPSQILTLSSDMNRISGRPLSGSARNESDEIWLEVLENIQISSIKEFMYQEGKLISLSFGAAPTVQLMFSSNLTKCIAEKYRVLILQAFESVLGSPLTIEIRRELKKAARSGVNMPLVLPGSDDVPSHMYTNSELMSDNRMAMIKCNDINSLGLEKTEIVEIASPGESRVDKTQFDRRILGSAWIGEAEASHKKFTPSLPEQRNLGAQDQSIVRSKVSLANVIQQAEGYRQKDVWSPRKAVSMAEKLEQENLKLEARSRSLLCWKASGVTRRKISGLKIRMRKPRTLLRYMSCGNCLFG